ncbi:MAG: flagellar biosynthesis repressor FlbT [Nitrospirota bacterium]
MALKINLRPHERLIVGGAVVANGDSRCTLLIENTVPILREKDILGEKNADSPCKRIYFVIQLMYVDEKKLTDHITLYWKLIADVANAAPSTLPLIEQINELIVAGKYYQALKKSKKLIEYEQEVLNRARN